MPLHVTLLCARVCSKMVGISGDCDQNGDRESKSDEICHICLIWLASVKVRYEKYGTLSMYLLSV